MKGILEERSVKIPSKENLLDGILSIPKEAVGLVLFVHGSGSSRFSVRNRYVASVLNAANFATILFDLLTPDEESIDDMTREFRFDVSKLAARLIDVTHWSLEQPKIKALPIGYFGASTGSAAALIAAATEPLTIKAVVSRGGRPDLAGPLLSKVKAPSLLIIGGNDPVVIQLNQEASNQMQCYRELHIVPGATHLFEEPGTLEEAAGLAKVWFDQYLIPYKRKASGLFRNED
jgi:pimeloyl-ACP methyl ester carboxylesterase